MIAIFKRGDGIEFSAEVGTAAFELMTKDGGFERIDTEPAKEEKPAVEIDLAKLSKKQLLEEAAKREVEVREEMTKAEILAAIEAAEGGE